MKQWYCTVKGQKYGPISKEQITQWIQQRRLTALDLVWQEGMADWTAAGQVAELQALLVGTVAGEQAAGATPPPVYAPGYGIEPTGASGYLMRRRGAAVLTWGILGLVVCFIFGIIAWSMGSTDLKAMAAGNMDRSGEGMTKAGKI
jgi:hypothetical protein